MKKFLLKTSWLALCFLTLVACEKDNPGADEDETPTIDETTSLSKKSGLPGQIFELTTANKITGENYLLRIGSEEVPAYKTSSNTLVFSLPYLSPGDYFIDLNIIDVYLGQLPIKVDQYTPIADIDQTYNEIMAWVEDKDAPVADQQIENLINLRIEQAFSRLTDDEKKAQLFQVKSFMEQVEHETAALEKSLAATAVDGQLNGIKKKSSVSLKSSSRPYRNARMQEINRHAADFLAAGMTIGAIGAVGVIASWASGPAAPVVGTFYALVMVKQVGRMLGIMLDSVVGMKNVVGIAISDAFSFRAHHVRQSTSPSGISTMSNGNSIVFIKDTPQEVDITFTFGSVALELESLVQSEFFGKFFATYHKFMELYTPLYNGQQKVQQLLLTEQQIFPPPSDFMPTDFVQEDLSVDAEEISITNISPTGLDIQIAQGENGILFTTSSATIIDSVDISFDIVYTQEEFEHTVTQTINASYDGREQETYRLEVASGNEQTGQYGNKLKEALMVKVTNQKGEPMVNAKVNWRIVGGNGQVIPHADTTDRTGTAYADWTLGTSGNQEVIAELLDNQGSAIAEVRFIAVIEENDLAGVWVMRSARRWGWTWGENEDGVRERKPYDGVENSSGLSITLNEDYTCIVIDEDGARSQGIYSTNGSKLILMNTEYTYSLTGNTLKTMFRHADAYGEHNSDTTFERIR